MSDNQTADTHHWPFYTDPQWLDVGDVRTAYRRAGEGEQLLYLHGAGLTRRWLPLYDQLASSVDVVVPEHPGFGDSEMPEWLESFEDLVLHYAELCDILGLKRFHLCGHSLGAWIAAEFAVYYPERLKSLTLITPPGLPGVHKVDTFRQEPEEALARLLNGQAELYPEYLDAGDPVEATVQSCKEKITQARLMWNPRHDLRLERRLRRVICPTQVVLPDEDRIFHHEVMSRYAELIPHASITTVTGERAPTGHLLIIQEPERLADAITTFVADAVRGG